MTRDDLCKQYAVGAFISDRDVNPVKLFNKLQEGDPSALSGITVWQPFEYESDRVVGDLILNEYEIFRNFLSEASGQSLHTAASCEALWNSDPSAYVTVVSTEFVRASTVLARPEAFRKGLVFKDAVEAIQFTEDLATNNS